MDEVTASYEQGVALQSDITRHQLRLEDLKVGLLEVQDSRDILNHQLCLAIGLDPSVKIEVDTTLIDQHLLVENEDYWKAYVDKTPMVKLANQGVRMSSVALDLAKGAKRPTISLFATNLFDGPILIEVPALNNNIQYFQIGVQFNYDFSSLWKANKGIAKAKAELAVASAQQEQASQAALNAIHASYVRLQEAYSRLSSRQVSVELATQNYDEVRYRYLNGLAVLTDMVDGANTMLRAELDLVNARIDILYQYYALCKTVGIL